MKRFYPINIYIAIIGLVMISISQYFLADYLILRTNYFLTPFLSWYTYSAALVLLIVIAIVNYLTIQKYLRIKQLRNN
jgi:amino acid transporter